MPKPTDITLKNLETSTEKFQYRTPIKFGGRVVNDALILNVMAEVETRDGRTGRGFGSMPMGNVWAWPGDTTSGEKTLEAMVRLGREIARLAATWTEPGHPLEITNMAAEYYESAAVEVTRDLAITDAMPRLAQLVAASPFEAAVHDAYGQTLERSSYDLLGSDFVNADLSAFLSADFADEYLDRYTLSEPKPTLPLYHLVGALDPLTPSDVDKAVGDGLPETLGDWIIADGLTHLKIKLAGNDLQWDIDRVVGVEKAACEAHSGRGCSKWHYSLDFNEKCPNVEYVLDFLARIEESSPEALSRVEYIEQPTHRDLRANPENRMHKAARIKPVVIDESLIDFESLLLAREQGYSGVALKACKGHTEALLMGAAAQKYEMFLCVQDLTCIGASFLHSASLASHIPTVAAIEGNGRQYCPAGNIGWDVKHPGMFAITSGEVQTKELNGAGLGYARIE